MTDLGTLGGSWAAAWGMSNLGHVVGNSETAVCESHAYLWTPDGGMTDLGTL